MLCNFSEQNLLIQISVNLKKLPVILQTNFESFINVCKGKIAQYLCNRTTLLYVQFTDPSIL